MVPLRDRDLVYRGWFQFESKFPLRTCRFVLRNVGVVGRKIGEMSRFCPLLVVHLVMSLTQCRGFMYITVNLKLGVNRSTFKGIFCKMLENGWCLDF